MNKRTTTKSAMVVSLFGLVAVLLGSVILASPGGAQEEGATCEAFGVDPPAESIWIPGNFDEVIVTLDNGDVFSVFNVVTNQKIDAPANTLIVSALKCNNPTPTATTAPTATVAPEPTPSAEPTSEPAPTATVAPTATAVPEPTPTPEEEVLPPPSTGTPTPTAEVEGKVEELALTGSDSTLMAVVAVTLIVGGAMLVGGGAWSRRRFS